MAVLAEFRRPHNTFTTAFRPDAYRNDQGMDMRTALIEVYLEADDVLLPESSGTPVMDIFRPTLYFLAPVQVAVVCIFFQNEGKYIFNRDMSLVPR